MQVCNSGGTGHEALFGVKEGVRDPAPRLNEQLSGCARPGPRLIRSGPQKYEGRRIAAPPLRKTLIRQRYFASDCDW